MERLRGRLFGLVAGWDRATTAALGIALGLMVIMLFVAAFGSSTIRQPALIGAGGLLIISQVIFMWGNRKMVTPFKNAQHAYLNEDFETASGILEDLRAEGKADVHVLTLLGNTYRQMGRLDQSETILREALEMRPSHYFPLYGFGRTLFVKGNYQEAAKVIEQALEAGAPPVVQFDLGHIYYRQGFVDQAVDLLQTARPLAQEPYRVFMIDYLLFKAGAGEAPARALIEEGLPYWHASAERFRDTPYGKTLADDIHELQALIEET